MSFGANVAAAALPLPERERAKLRLKRTERECAHEESTQGSTRRKRRESKYNVCSEGGREVYSYVMHVPPPGIASILN